MVVCTTASLPSTATAAPTMATAVHPSPHRVTFSPKMRLAPIMTSAGWRALITATVAIDALAMA
ncbi:MAG: hypothetical protein OEY41_11390 [Acidimicrobiia bacterium]|nr:hypothetical protein [Acidimicrobiia bacterium]MDH5290590.1 hypothetical protein [Acidimicrobiia bacterium]